MLTNPTPCTSVNWSKNVLYIRPIRFGVIPTTGFNNWTWRATTEQLPRLYSSRGPHYKHDATFGLCMQRARHLHAAQMNLWLRKRTFLKHAYFPAKAARQKRKPAPKWGPKAHAHTCACKAANATNHCNQPSIWDSEAGKMGLEGGGGEVVPPVSFPPYLCLWPHTLVGLWV